MRVCKIFRFDAAHYLPEYEGKCRQLHGHSWTLEVEVEGPVGEGGMVVDFAELKQLVDEKVIRHLDHRLVNDVISVQTAENILLWVWEQLDGFGPPWCLARLRLYETPDSFAEVKIAGRQEKLV